MTSDSCPDCGCPAIRGFTANYFYLFDSKGDGRFVGDTGHAVSVRGNSELAQISRLCKAQRYSIHVCSGRSLKSDVRCPMSDAR